MTQNALVRRRRHQPPDPTLRLITFQLRHHWFALPLVRARRVLPPAAQGTDVGLTQLHNDAIVTLDAATLVYEAVPSLPAGAESLPPEPLPPSLGQSILIVDRFRPDSPAADRAAAGSPRDLVGLLVDGAPALRRVRESAIRPLPSMYLTLHRLRGISAVIDLSTIPDPQNHPLFLLDLEVLLAQLG